MGNKGENLIFLISQMRGGSTLLQNILSGHPEIHTLPEPWIALPVLSTLYTRKISGEYNTDYNLYWARTAMKGFVEKLPGGEEDYLESVRRMYAHLYERALAGSGRRYFLDKGPRYFLIIPELLKVFPEAKFILLFRNPLAVLSSINSRWMKNDFRSIHQFRYDLLKAPRLLLEGRKLLGERGIVAGYEKLLSDPETEIRKICEKLGIGFSSGMLNYEHKAEYDNGLGYQEQREEYKSGGPDADNADRWISTLNHPGVWRITSDYLSYLGRNTLAELGYSFDDLRKTLDQHNPGRLRTFFSPPLLRLIKRGMLVKR